MKRHLRTHAAFTLTETLVASFIGFLVILIGLVVFTQTLRLAEYSRAESGSVRGAALIVQELNILLSEAGGVQLPDDTLPTWNPDQLGATSRYRSTASAASNTYVNTGLYVLFSSAGTTRVQDSSGNPVVLSGANAPFTRWSGQIQRTALIFRGNANGTVNPLKGTYLWLWEYNNGTCFRKSVLRRDLATAWNAVQFSRAGNSLVRIKLVVQLPTQPGMNISSENRGSGSAVLEMQGQFIRLHNTTLSKTLTIAYPNSGDDLPSPP